MNTFFARTASGIALVTLAAACSGDATAPRGTKAVSLSISARSSLHPAPSLGTSLSPAGDLIIGTGSTNTVRITAVQVVLAHVQLSRADSCTPGKSDDNCDELETAPILVDVPLDTIVKKAVDAQIPIGTYVRLQAELAALTASGDGASFLTAHPDFKGISVRVTGTYTDAAGTAHPFTYTSAVDAELEVVFPKPITVGPATSNLTINIDIASWFQTADGSAIDPTTAANATVIDANIRKSFHAFEDDHENGTDDNR